MGTEERDWLEVANDLLYKAHINLRLNRLTDCDANVFVALYEAILSDKVPDYIAFPRSQEDDIHNVQSVIDSLALDYLHISLSHITGENIVRGDCESVRNLLEIFDGLLEYLTEQLSEDEELQNGERQPNGAGHTKSPERQPREQDHEDLSQASSAQSVVQSSKHSLHSWNGDESESTAELIRLGDSARTFSKKEAGPSVPGATSEAPEALCGAYNGPTVAPASATTSTGNQATLLREPLHSAIPLQPPFQTTPQRSGQTPPATTVVILAPPHSSRSATLSPASAKESEGEPATGSLQNGHSLRTPGESLHAGRLLSPSSPCSPVTSDKSSSSLKKVNGEGRYQSENTSRAAVSGPRRVLFRTEPDVLLLSLREELEGPPLCNGHPKVARVNGETHRHRPDEDVDEDEELLPLSSSSSSSRRRERGRGAKDTGRHRGERVSVLAVGRSPGHTEPLSRRSQRNRKTEQELHDMSEKLSRRLEELDRMLKRALGEDEREGEDGETPEGKEDDKQSHHSDSIMERRRPATDVSLTNGVTCTRSLSPSPPPLTRRPLRMPPEEAVATGHDPAHHSAHTRRRELRQLYGHRRRGQMVGKAYEEELKRYEDAERAEMAKERLEIGETEREYREALRREDPRSPKSVGTCSPKASGSPSSSFTKRTPAGRKPSRSRKASPMRLKENDLLPTLLEEFPGLQVSPHTLTRMWKQQLRQVDHLNAPENQRSRIKLASQVEEAEKRHDLLVEIIRKEQEHNRRLKDHRERVQKQKSAQNRLRDQRQQIARAKKYYSDYHLQLRSRLARARTREERLFKQIFEEGVALQKARLREERSYAKEQRQEHQRRHRTQLEAMENYYKDQMSLLAETLAQERQEIQVRKKAQEKALQKLKRELRNKMEREIGELQRIIIQNDEDDYFRDLEAERLRSRLQMASFQYNTSCLH